VKETVNRERATAAWFGRYWAMVRAASDEASVPVTALAVAAATGGRPPSNNSVRGSWFGGSTVRARVAMVARVRGFQPGFRAGFI
jgi:hypothetical protein